MFPDLGTQEVKINLKLIGDILILVKQSAVMFFNLPNI